MPVTHSQAGISDKAREHLLVAALSFVPTDSPTCIARSSSYKN
jgi:hypothetical protein